MALERRMGPNGWIYSRGGGDSLIMDEALYAALVAYEMAKHNAEKKRCYDICESNAAIHLMECAALADDAAGTAAA